MGQISTAIQKVNQYKTEFINFGELSIWHARYLQLLGEIDFAISKLDSAHEYFLKAQNIIKQIDQQNDLSNTYLWIGLVYIDRGENIKSLENLHISLELIGTVNNSPLVVSIYKHLAYIKYVQGKITSAVEYHIKSVEIAKKILNHKLLSSSYLAYIRTLLDNNERIKAEKILIEFEQLSQSTNIRSVSIEYNFSKALYLKYSDRNRYKVQAEEIFESILKEPGPIERHIILQSSFHLVDLLLAELKLYGQKPVLNQILQMIDQMYNQAQQSGMHSVTVRFVILKSKLAIIQGDLGKASEFLDQAIAIAEENDEINVLAQANKEKEQMANDFTNLKDFLEKNQEIGARMEYIEFESYFNSLQSMKKK